MVNSRYRSNRFVARPNQTHSQTWHVFDRATGEIVVDGPHSPDSAKDWAAGMNDMQRAGQMINTLSGELAPVPGYGR